MEFINGVISESNDCDDKLEQKFKYEFLSKLEMKNRISGFYLEVKGFRNWKGKIEVGNREKIL